MTSQLIADALMMAVWLCGCVAVWRRGKPVALLHHSDQGSQYTSEHFQVLALGTGHHGNHERAGEVWENSAIESFFFSSLKAERTAGKAFGRGRMLMPMFSTTSSALLTSRGGTRR